MSSHGSADSIGRAYVRMAFHIDRLAPGFIDAYFGPAEWKAPAEGEGQPSPADLLRDAEALLRDIALVSDAQRRDWLTKQVTAMIAMLRRAAGETLSFDEELRLLYDIQPARTDEREFDEGRRAVEDLLPGGGTLAERMEAWKAQFAMPKEKLLPLLTTCLQEVRRRTRKLFTLPEDEGIVLQMVEQQPWSAYNWYLGHFRSRVDMNTDLPIHANSMLGLVAHEGYPGHHTEHAIKEERLYRQQGRAEACVQLLNAPESVISEGIADLALEIIFTREELESWLRDRFYPEAGVRADAARDLALQRTLRSFVGKVAGNAAFMLYGDGADEPATVDYLLRYSVTTEREARQLYRFISTPLYGSYIFNYHYGRELLDRYLRSFGAGERIERFRTLLEQPFTPSGIARLMSPASG